jgi:uncharacterized coiled-coil protein SlyX
MKYEEWDKFYEKYEAKTVFDDQYLKELKEVITQCRYTVAMPKNGMIALLARLESEDK